MAPVAPFRLLPDSTGKCFTALLGVILVLLLSGCSDDKATTSPDTTGEPAVTAVLPEGGSPVSTTTIAGTAVPSGEVYAQAGLTAEQGRCIDASGVDGDFAVTPGETPSDPMVLESDAARVEVPATVRTGEQLEQVMLEALAASCAPAEALQRLAAIDGLALDTAALVDDLPVRILQRTADGATAVELACLEAEFRAAPARLSSLASDPASVEARCASDERRAAWRFAALDRGLTTAGASATERACLIGEPGDLATLDEAVEAVRAGDTSGVAPDGSSAPVCATVDRLLEIALEIVAESADFGAETLSGR